MERGAPEDGMSYHDLPEWAKDRIYTDVVCHIGWLDRFRLLVQGQFTVEVRNTVEHAPGRVETTSAIRFPHHCWPWRRHKHIGYEAELPSEE